MINIQEDYRYFTHLLGKESVVPLSKARVKAYPTRIEVSAGDEKSLIQLKVTGPVKGFTHLLNIEKARVEVFGKGKEGYYHFYFFAKNGSLFVKLVRGAIAFEVDGKEYVKGESISLFRTDTIDMPKVLEKISFGCFKKPLLEKKVDSETKLYTLAQLIPEEDPVELSKIEMLTLFKDLLVPTNKDSEYRGLEFQEKDFTPFALFSTFKRSWKRSLVKQEQDVLYLLPAPSQLPVSGRAEELQTKNFSINLLWKKGKVVRCSVTSNCACVCKFVFSFSPKKFRVKRKVKEKGTFVSGEKNITFSKNQTLYIDRITF